MTGIGNDTSWPMTEPFGSKGKKSSELDSWTLKRTRSAQGNDRSFSLTRYCIFIDYIILVIFKES